MATTEAFTQQVRARQARAQRIGGCTRCGSWGRPRGDGICDACAKWVPRGRRTGPCLRCGHHTRIASDQHCRLCLIDVRHGDVEWAIAMTARGTLPPRRPQQLALLLDGLPFAKTMPLRRHDRPTTRPDRARRQHVPTVASDILDDQRICPSQIPGQIALLRPPRAFTAYDAHRISDRPLPGFDQVVAAVRCIVADRGFDIGTGRQIVAMSRLALAAREPDDHMVPEEHLDDLPTHRRTVAQALRDVDLLRPRGDLAPARLVRRPRLARTQRMSVPVAPLRSCGHCLAWAGEHLPICRACQQWDRQHLAGHCGRCLRLMPLVDRLCRFCTLGLREQPLTGGSADQQWFGLVGIAPVLRTAHRPRRFVKAGLSRALRVARNFTRTISEHLLDPAQLELFATPARDWLPALRAQRPLLTPSAQQLLDELDHIAHRGRWSHRQACLRTLRVVAGWLGAEAPIREIDIAALALLTNGNTANLRVAQFLDTKGLLVPDPAKAVDRDQAAVDRVLHALPVTIAPDVELWVTAMRGHGRRESPPRSWVNIRSYLRDMTPTLHAWGRDHLDLRSITPDHIRATLKIHQQPQRLHVALRSLVRALRRERRVFRDPARTVSLATRRTIPRPLSSDRVSGLIDRADNNVTKLVIALLAIHAIRPGEIRDITLARLDRTRGTLTTPRRGGHVRKILLDELTLVLVTNWLRERAQRWPASTNPHLVVSQISAYDTRDLPVTKLMIQKMLQPLGVTATQLVTDRILDEARHTEDPIHLMQLFGIGAATAVKYLHAACPEKFVNDLAGP